MQKITVITGPEESGKSFLANNISLAYQKPHFIDGRSTQRLNGRFLFKDVEVDTDLIVFDDVSVKNITNLIFRTYRNIVIEKRGVNYIEIDSPKILITTSCDMQKIISQGASISRRIEIIECEKTGNIFNFKKL